MALRDVFAHLTTREIDAKIVLLDGMMRRLKGGAARIGVAALNPHAGEEGLFGDEESRLISPAVAAAKARGIDVEGPFPTDTLMVKAREAKEPEAEADVPAG